MGDEGYIHVHRKLRRNWLAEQRPYCPLGAWVDMLMAASHGNHPLLKRGQLFATHRRMAARWGWSRAKVRRFLARLEREGQITTEQVQLPPPKGRKGVRGSPVRTVITLLNYPAMQAQTRPEMRPEIRGRTGPKSKPANHLFAGSYEEGIWEPGPKCEADPARIPAHSSNNELRQGTVTSRGNPSYLDEVSKAGKVNAALLRQRNGRPRCNGTDLCTCHGCLRRLWGAWVEHPELVTHKAFTGPMEDELRRAVKAGYRHGTIEAAFTRYAELVKRGTAPGRNRWTMVQLLGRDKRTYLDLLNDPRFRGFENKPQAAPWEEDESLAELQARAARVKGGKGGTNT